MPSARLLLPSSFSRLIQLSTFMAYLVVFTSSVKDGRWKLKYFLHDPTSTSISVNQTGAIKFLEPVDMSQQGEDVHIST